MKTVARRSVIKKMAVGGAALAGLSALPDRWTAPLVEFGSLPAHATTSGSIESVIEELKQELDKANHADEPVASQATVAETQASAPEPPPVEEMYGYAKKEEGKHVGPIHISGHYPQRFIFSKDGPEYGNEFLIVCNDGQQMHVTEPTRGFIISTGNRKYVAGEPYFVSGEAPGKYPTMEYYADYSTKPNRCWVYYERQ